MFHLVVMACLANDPTICTERLLVSVDYATEPACQANAPTVVQAWGGLHDDLTLGAWRCSATADLPAFTLKEIAPGVFVHAPKAEPLSPRNGGDIANLGVVIGDTVAVIDPGGSRDIAEKLYAAIRQITDKPISHAIITHMHPDHSFGAEVFAEAGAMIIAHKNLPSGIERRLQTWTLSIPRQAGALAMLGTRVRLPDRTVAVPENLALGGATLQLTPVPTAHTDNDLTIYHVESGTLFTGDLVFSDLTPSLDGSLKGWLLWLATPPDPLPRQIVAGHGPVPMTWVDGTAGIRAYLTALADEARTAIKAGEPMSTAVTHIGTGQKGDWRGFDEMNAHNAIAAYKELEWE
jgi:quinoprotein relay system zinc metallohydrolase 2